MIASSFLGMGKYYIFFNQVLKHGVDRFDFNDMTFFWNFKKLSIFMYLQNTDALCIAYPIWYFYLVIRSNIKEFNYRGVIYQENIYLWPMGACTYAQDL